MGNEMSRVTGHTDYVNERQVQMIKESWKVIHDDMSNIGVVMFTRLFEAQPECKDAFVRSGKVKHLMNFQTSPELRAHALSVMMFLEKAVATLHLKQEVETLAFELGKKHYYNAPTKYYDYVGEAFVQAVKPAMKERWTTELEEAWRALFHYLTSQMKKGFQEEKTTLDPK